MTTHVRKVVGSNLSTIYWIDLQQKLYCLFEKTEINEKEAGVGHLKKKTVYTLLNLRSVQLMSPFYGLFFRAKNLIGLGQYYLLL